MSDDSLRRRLEALNRAPIAGAVRDGNALGVPPAARVEHLAVHLPMSSVAALQPIQEGSSSAAARIIPGLMHRGDVVSTAFGEHLCIRLPLESLWPGGDRLVATRQQFLQEQLSIARQAVNPTVVMHAEFTPFVSALPERMLLLDLETCGLAGAALFLVGILRQIDGTPTVELLLARNYAEEAAVLASLWQLLGSHDVLVTFNGKTFDWPMVLERSVRHRLNHNAAARPPHHVDVLHHARRRWRKQLPNCRLQTLERFVCRRHRRDDIPGHRIPSVYADYVRTGFERDMDTVLYHNAIDLVTLFDLSLRLAG
jgi:uncharacterized protein YprB with RNaseH-like and TPR domain